MGRTKGFKVLKKAAEEFVNFKPPKVSDKIHTHPKVLEIHNQLTKPLLPLKYKLQELPSPDTTWNTPLGGTNAIPFQISRTWTGNLPVYTEFRNDRSRKLTIIRKILGDVEEFKTELQKVVSNSPIYEKNGRIEVKGLHSESVKLWLRKLGF
ncbi:unnamed protein product [Blepharisma stoltei]|uniref:Large ribosomal subunit protein mL49 n=1 Tax=Blepharisma stoltei TaxID=1481888 RepID=A0AAU9IXZ8_9CILI|nr:unnamed protein product [Blepharisma stoltei]